jgi:hypothetical protein
MRRVRLLFAALVLASALSSQDLPQEVLVLSRAKNRLSEDLQRLTTISCVETVRREQQPPKGRMRPLDTVRLEVLTNGKKELYASPGDRQFSEKQPIEYVGSGMLGNGLFGLYLRDTVLNPYASTQNIGEELTGGRHLTRYDFRIPPQWAGQTIEVPGGSGKVGVHGSFWIDSRSYDLVRLELHADTFPPTLPVLELTTNIDYGRTILGADQSALLPETADIREGLVSGQVSHNVVEFTHCRTFAAQSTLRFDSDSTAAARSVATAPVDESLRPLPSGLLIPVLLRSRISADMAVGSLVEGTVASDVKEKRTVVIPAGSTVRGRIRRLERYSDPISYFIVGLEFTEVEVEGVAWLFYADISNIGPSPGVTRTLAVGDTHLETDGVAGTVSRDTKESLFLYDLPGVAAFFFLGSKLDLPANFRTEWRTRPFKH